MADRRRRDLDLADGPGPRRHAVPDRAANNPAREISFSGFFLVKDGTVTLLGGDRDAPGTFPNGITLLPDEKYLYVTACTHLFKVRLKAPGVRPGRPRG